MLEIDDIFVSYGEIRALWGVSLKAEKGEIIGLLGPNGAGKTTTFQTIPGLKTPEKGQIILNGKNITKLKPGIRVNLGIAYVPEGRRLFPQMTVLDNLLMGNYSKRAKKNRQQLLKWIFDLFPILNQRVKQEAKTLSGGEQQMLAISRALMSDPELLILDEPSLGLAPKIVQELFNIFKEINQRGVTILISEQHVHMVLKIIHRAYVLEEGKIVLQGSPNEISSNDHIKKAYLGL